MVNSPLLPGDYTLEIMGINGTPGDSPGLLGNVNIIGENASGYLSAWSMGATADIWVGGQAKVRAGRQRSPGRSSGFAARGWTMPEPVARYLRRTGR
jgi:hypothetical protein